MRTIDFKFTPNIAGRTNVAWEGQGGWPAYFNEIPYKMYDGDKLVLLVSSEYEEAPSPESPYICYCKKPNLVYNIVPLSSSTVARSNKLENLPINDAARYGDMYFGCFNSQEVHVIIERSDDIPAADDYPEWVSPTQPQPEPVVPEPARDTFDVSAGNVAENFFFDELRSVGVNDILFIEFKKL